MKLFKTLIRYAVLIFSICRAHNLHAVAEFWLSPSNAVWFYTNTASTPNVYQVGNPSYGTRADVPLFGDFDTVLTQITNEFAEIHLFPGVYYTAGLYTSHSSPLKKGFKIRGA